MHGGCFQCSLTYFFFFLNLLHLKIYVSNILNEIEDDIRLLVYFELAGSVAFCKTKRLLKQCSSEAVA